MRSIDCSAGDVWQPIKTVPKTGERVLLWSRKAGHFVGNSPEGYYPAEWIEGIDNKWHADSHWRAKAATHWQRLNEPKEDK